MNFIELRDTNDNLKLLNINHIISVEPHSIKIGEKDRCYKLCTKITSVGAMVSTTIVYESVSKVGELIKSVNGAY
tara:strand:+ start:166 stop:390 length:225 start_codon:yes stop_codon:yes gene_type:complete